MVTKRSGWTPRRKRGTCRVCGRPDLALMRGGLIWSHRPLTLRGGRKQLRTYLDARGWCAGGGHLSVEGTLT